jgi:hypothetical protein
MVNIFKRKFYMFVMYTIIIKNLCSSASTERQGTIVYNPASCSEFGESGSVLWSVVLIESFYET